MLFRSRKAICTWYERRYNVSFDPDKEAIVTIGSKEGIAHLALATLERGDVVELDYRITPTINVNAYGDYFGGLVAFRSNLAQQFQRYVLITPARRRFNILEQRMSVTLVHKLFPVQIVVRW
mgnify:CR=1 FL=1